MLSLIVILAVTVITVAGQTITITGTSTLVTPTSELRITCQPSTAGIDDINTISIRKNTSTADYTTLVSVIYDKSNGGSAFTWPNAAFQNRVGVSATGNVNTVGGARLELTISQNNTRCEDGGAYQCIMGVTLTGGSGGVADAEKYVAVTELPTYTNALFVSPPPNVNGQYYSLGTTLTFSCSGTVGSDKKIHTWCYRQAGSTFGFTGYPAAADIDQNEAGLVKGGCNWRRTSTLAYNVTSADTETTFMCEPYTGSLCGSSAAGLKANSTFRVYVPVTTTPVPVSVKSTDVPVTTTPVPVSVKSTDDALPWIVVAVVFIVIIIALIFAVVYLCLQVRKYKERLRERLEYQGINTGFSRRDDHVYSTTETYEIPQSTLNRI